MTRRTPRLEQIRLPIMPETARQLKRLLGLHSTRHLELQQVLLSDPAATVAVFRALGQTRPGAHEHVSDVAHAVSMIGIDAFSRVIDELSKVAAEPDPKQNGVSDAYSQAAHAAYYAGALSAYKRLDGNREIPTAALLQNPAVLALWQTEPDSARRATYAVRTGVPASVAFHGELGEPLEDANRRLAEVWSLPMLARQSMGAGDDLGPRPRAVRLADDIARTTATNWHSEETASVTTRLSEFMDLDEDQARAWLHETATDATRSMSRFDYPLPGFELLMLPGDEEEDDDEDIPLMGSVRRRPDKPAAAADLHTTVASVMQRIRADAGAGRVVFAMLNKERSHLRTRLALGGDKEDGIRRLDLALAQKNLFTILMGKPQSLWLNRDNAGRYQPYLPTGLRRLLRPQGAYMMSLFVGERPLGLMYGDGADLSEQGYRQFRTLCSEATAALSGNQPNR